MIWGAGVRPVRVIVTLTLLERFEVEIAVSVTLAGHGSLAGAV
jgi:hypothetical protein